MADIQRISVQQAHAKTKANQALLVCAYDDEAKCRKINLEGSISLASFQSRVGVVAEDRGNHFLLSANGGRERCRSGSEI